MKRKFLALCLAAAMALSLASCGGGESESSGGSSVTREPGVPAANMSGDGSWAVYWYLCGSDLETNGGCATADLGEMMEVTLPENVTVVIQTGGAAVWQNNQMDPDKPAAHRGTGALQHGRRPDPL